MPSERWTKKKRDQLDSLLTFAPDNQQLSWPDVDHLDQERLWWSMRGLDRAAMMVLLARALAKVPASQLESVCRDYFFAGDIGGVSTHVELDLCAAVHRFCRFSKAGHFYEYMDYRGSEQSDGTHNFCARCQSTFERCVAESETTDPALVVVALEELMDLLRHIDECHDDVVHFTDEAGSWQVGVDWRRVLPAYFQCLARVKARAEYEAAVSRAIEDFAHEDRSKLQPIADSTYSSLSPTHQ